MAETGSDRVDEATIGQALTTRWLGRPVQAFEGIASTNEWLKERTGGDGYLPTGALVVADYQSEGKGRMGRRWEAPPGTSLLFSLLLRPEWPAEQANWLTMIAGLAAAEGIDEATGLAVGLKWPNDLVAGETATGYRKLGGILLEAEMEDGRLRWAVLGVGVNVNMAAGQMPAGQPQATSILVETGKASARAGLLAAILRRLEAHYEAAVRGKSPQPAWNERLVTRGQWVRLTGQGGAAGEAIEGLVEGTDGWGRLLVRERGGALRVVAAGDVTLRS